jgi:NitT/TauT family transport system substrate-binding protein
MDHSQNAPRGISRRKLLTTAGATAGLALAGSVLSPYIARAAGPKIRMMCNWFAEAEHGGFYHAVAAGLYEKAGIDVDLRQGGMQLNTMSLLAGGEIDVAMSYDIQVLNSLEKGVPVRALFTSFQFDLIGMLTRPDVASLADLKGRNVYFAGSGYSTYWPWLKARYGYTDEMAKPKGSNLQTFINDTTSAAAGYLTSEPYVAQAQNLATKFFLFAKEGYPPYGNSMITTADFLAKNGDALARFTKASVEGWKAYLIDPTIGNNYIKKINPKMDDGQIAFTLEKMREVKAVEGGDAETMGIGYMKAERWQATRDFLVEAKLLKPETDWKQVLALDFIKDLKITL